MSRSRETGAKISNYGSGSPNNFGFISQHGSFSDLLCDQDLDTAFSNPGSTSFVQTMTINILYSGGWSARA